MNMEDRLRAHYAERTDREPLPGPDPDEALDNLLSGEIPTPKPTPTSPGTLPNNVRRFPPPFRPLALAAAVLAVCAIAGLLVVRTDDNTVSNLPDDDQEEPRPDPTTTSSTAPPATSSSVPAPPPETTAVPSASSLSVVVGPWGALGWWNGTAWVTHGLDAVIPVIGGEEYQIVRLDDPITTSIGGWGSGCFASGDERGDVDAAIPRDEDERTPFPIAVTGVPTPRPRPVRVVEASSADRTQAVSVLAGLGIDDSNPNISQVIKSDMDGDGMEEVIVVADRLRPEAPYHADPADYSVVFMRHTVGGVQHVTVISSQRPSGDAGDGLQYLEVSQVAAVADLNGDDRMELIEQHNVYEGTSISVLELQPDGTFRPALSGVCGA